MADDILSSFLVKIAYDQDQKSRKDFDEGLKRVQTRAEEFGAKIGELPTIVSDATKRISFSLSELWYASQKTGASAEQIDALRKAAVQSGEGADNAQRSWEGWSETFRKFGDAAARQLQNLYGIKYDPKDSFGAFLKAREKAAKEYNEATDKEGKGRAIARASALSIEEDALIKHRQDIFGPYFEKQLASNLGIEAEKAAALTRAYNALSDAIQTVARKADAALFDKFMAILDRITSWLNDDSDRIVKFFTELVTQIGHVFTDLSKLGPVFVFLWDALKEVGGWLQKIIGQPDGTGLAGVRHLLELISGIVMVRFVASMVAGFIAAFAPLTALLAGLAALGIIGVGAYAAGEAVRGWLGGGAGAGGAGGGFGPGEGTESGGHGAQRRGRFGHGGARGGGGGADAGGVNTGGTSRERIATAMAAMKDQLRKEGVPEASIHAAAALMVGQAMSESSLDPNAVHDQGTGFGIYGARDPRNERNPDFRRKTRMLEWLAAHGYAKNSLEGQSRQMIHAAMTDPRFVRTRNQLMRASESGLASATHVITPNFEGPLVDNSGQRIPHVRAAFGHHPITNPLAHIPPASDFHKALETIRAKPSTPWQQSMNEIHDHRAVTNDVNIHIAGDFPVEKTERPLSRPRNADSIRNTTSYAA
jgi:hypothetical protein